MSKIKNTEFHTVHFVDKAFMIDQKHFHFKNGIYQGVDSDVESLKKIPSAHPILDENGEIINPEKDMPSTKSKDKATSTQVSEKADKSRKVYR